MGTFRMYFSGLCGFVPSSPLPDDKNTVSLKQMRVLLPDLREPQPLSFKDKKGLVRELLHPHFPTLAIWSDRIQKPKTWQKQAPEIISNRPGPLKGKHMTLYDLNSKELHIKSDNSGGGLSVPYKKPPRMDDPTGYLDSMQWVPRVRDVLPGAEVTKNLADLKPVITSSITLDRGVLKTAELDRRTVKGKPHYGVWRFKPTNTPDSTKDLEQCVARQIVIEQSFKKQVELVINAGKVVLHPEKSGGDIEVFVSNGELYELLGLKTSYIFTGINRDTEALFDLSKNTYLQGRPCPHFVKNQPPTKGGGGSLRRPCSALLFDRIGT